MPSWPRDPNRFRFRLGCDGDLVLFINGILTLPSDQFGWTDRAERWTGDFSRHEFDSIEYFHTPLLGLAFERKTVQQAAWIVAEYLAAWKGNRPLRIHLVGHSRGCEIARRLIVEHGVPVDTLHFFAPAVDRDFERNGLGPALHSGLVRQLHIYGAATDRVLSRFARWSFGIYGTLGCDGPLNAEGLRISRDFRRGYGHGTWFDRSHFEDTMNALERAIDSDVLPL